MELFFSPNSSGHLRSYVHQSQIIGRDADVDHTQTIGGDTVKLLGGIYPPGFVTPACIKLCKMLSAPQIAGITYTAVILPDQSCKRADYFRFKPGSKPKI